jgi:hypothetical protein
LAWKITDLEPATFVEETAKGQLYVGQSGIKYYLNGPAKQHDVKPGDVGKIYRVRISRYDHIYIRFDNPKGQPCTECSSMGFTRINRYGERIRCSGCDGKCIINTKDEEWN